MKPMLSPDEAWREMRLHIEWANGFVLCFVFSDSNQQAGALLQRLDDAWRFRTAPVSVIQPDPPEQLVQQVFDALARHRQLGFVAPAWLQLSAEPAMLAWDQARTECLARLNEARDWLMHDFAQPLVLCLPRAWLGQVAGLAPDLWHVRSFVAELQAAPAPALARDAAADDVLSGLRSALYPAVAPQIQRVEQARSEWDQHPGDARLRELAVALGGLSERNVSMTLRHPGTLI